jgi:hypothetical protein
MKERLILTLIGTVWVSAVLAGYIWLGSLIRAEDAAYFYYSIGLVVTGGFASVPFIIYHYTKDHE